MKKIINNQKGEALAMPELASIALRIVTPVAVGLHPCSPSLE